MKRIEITIDQQGHATVETFGFVGNECRDASKLIEKALGAVQAEQLKSEYHQTRQSNEQQAHQG